MLNLLLKGRAKVVTFFTEVLRKGHCVSMCTDGISFLRVSSIQKKRYTTSSRILLLDNIVLALRLNYVKKVNIKRYKRSLFHNLPLSNEKHFNETQPYFM